LGNLLVTIAEAHAAVPARQTHQAAVALLSQLKHQQPRHELAVDGCWVAAYPRINGSGGALLRDPASGCWITGVGTWFHDHGFGVGREDRLLARLSEIGAERLARELEGFFVIVAGNAASREVVVITDAVGTLHCYSREVPGATVICTSSLVLAALGDATLDPLGCQEFVQTAACYGTRTFYREVRKLDAARCHVFGPAGPAIRRYWHPTDLAPDSLDGSAALEAFTSAMRAAARKIAAAYPKPALDLTGGYDSRTAVAAFVSARSPFDTVVAGESDHHDVAVANSLARRAGFRHHQLRPGVVESHARLQSALDLTDGEWDLVEYARVREVHEQLSRSFDASVNGYSGEIGRGYGWEVLAPHTGESVPLDAGHIARKRMLNASFDATLLSPDVRVDPAEHYTQMFAELARGLESLPNTIQYDYVMTMTRCQRWYGRIASSTNQIWPCLSIFLLMSVIRPMLQTTTRSRRNSALFRHALQEMSPLLANQPLANGYPPAPVTVRNFYRFWPMLAMYGGKAVSRIRRAAGLGAPPPFGPVQAARLRLAADEAVREALQPARMRSAGLYQPEVLRRYVSQVLDTAVPAPAQWSLVLTLEYALNRQQALRSNQSRPTG
jgi:hypothetical protein